MIASNSVRATIENLRLGHRIAADRFDALAQALKDFKTTDVLLFVCPEMNCQRTFSLAEVGTHGCCPQHKNPTTDRECLGSHAEFTYRIIELPAPK